MSDDKDHLINRVHLKDFCILIKNKRQAHGPKRSPEYQRLYTNRLARRALSHICLATSPAQNKEKSTIAERKGCIINETLCCQLYGAFRTNELLNCTYDIF